MRDISGPIFEAEKSSYEARALLTRPLGSMLLLLLITIIIIITDFYFVGAPNIGWNTGYHN
jgi:hypothetical protein